MCKTNVCFFNSPIAPTLNIHVVDFLTFLGIICQKWRTLFQMGFPAPLSAMVQRQANIWCVLCFFLLSLRFRILFARALWIH